MHVDDLANQGLDFRRLRNVRLDEMRLATCLANGLQSLVAAIGIDVGDDDAGTFPGEEACSGATDSGAAAGDENYLVLQPVWNRDPSLNK